MIALPETFLFRGTDREFGGVPETLAGPSMAAMSAAARRWRVHLLAGSFAESVRGSKKTYNTSCFFGPSGKLLAVYRKLHLFDVDLPPSAGRSATQVRESDRCLRGKKPVTATFTGRKGAAVMCGLSICFDLRFPELYRSYALRGARVLLAPSNFTRHTGRDHWEPLLRARAIENQCFVIAPGQSGIGSQGVLSHGTSLIIDPWGHVLAKGPASGKAVVFADLDLRSQDRVRQVLPVLKKSSL